MKLKLLATLSLAFLLGGCAFHMSKEQCQTTNWYQLGYNNGANGQEGNITSNSRDCAKYHISVNLKAYQKGWDKGIRTFCTYRKGYNFAMADKPNPNACPASIKRHFDEGYQKGTRKLCNNPSAGFALGRDGASFPSACSEPDYFAFRTAYQRGQMINNRVSNLKYELNSVNGRIDDLVSNYGFRQTADGYYSLGDKQDNKAQFRLKQVNRMVRESKRIQSQIFRASVHN